MAGTTKVSNGHYAVQVMIGDCRRTIRLGKANQRTAEHVKTLVERIQEARAFRIPLEARVAEEINQLPSPILERLTKLGLIGGRETPPPLGKFLQDYVAHRTDVKAATIEIWGHTVRNLIEHFGESCDLRTITAGDANAFRVYLKKVTYLSNREEKKLASTTISKRLQFARAFLEHAVDREFIQKNPFAKVSHAATIDKEQRPFVTRELIEQILQVADLHWRVIICLCRYGGLRCPSEVLSLRWDGVDFDNRRIKVLSPKTEHCNKASRLMPLFPELLTPLQELRAAAPTDDEFVLQKFRHLAPKDGNWRNANLRTQFKRVIKKAGVEPWKRLFHSLRAACETELCDRFPTHVVTGWMGNTPDMVQKHYGLTTDDHFARAIGGTPVPQSDRMTAPPGAAKSAARSARALQKREQQASARVGKPRQAQNKTLAGARVYASRCDSLRNGANSNKRRGQDSNPPQKRGKNGGSWPKRRRMRRTRRTKRPFGPRVGGGG